MPVSDDDPPQKARVRPVGEYSHSKLQHTWTRVERGVNGKAEADKSTRFSFAEPRMKKLDSTTMVVTNRDPAPFSTGLKRSTTAQYYEQYQDHALTDGKHGGAAKRRRFEHLNSTLMELEKDMNHEALRLKQRNYVASSSRQIEYDNLFASRMRIKRFADRAFEKSRKETNYIVHVMLFDGWRRLLGKSKACQRITISMYTERPVYPPRDDDEPDDPIIKRSHPFDVAFLMLTFYLIKIFAARRKYVQRKIYRHDEKETKGGILKSRRRVVAMLTTRFVFHTWVWVHIKLTGACAGGVLVQTPPGLCPPIISSVIELQPRRLWLYNNLRKRWLDVARRHLSRKGVVETITIQKRRTRLVRAFGSWNFWCRKRVMAMYLAIAMNGRGVQNLLEELEQDEEDEQVGSRGSMGFDVNKVKEGLLFANKLTKIAAGAKRAWLRARKHLDHHNEENQQPPEPEPASPKKSDTSPGKKEKLKPKKPKKPPEDDDRTTFLRGSLLDDIVGHHKGKFPRISLKTYGTIQIIVFNNWRQAVWRLIIERRYAKAKEKMLRVRVAQEAMWEKNCAELEAAIQQQKIESVRKYREAVNGSSDDHDRIMRHIREEDQWGHHIEHMKNKEVHASKGQIPMRPYKFLSTPKYDMNADDYSQLNHDLVNNTVSMAAQLASGLLFERRSRV
jgi:hypothetical protein